MELPARRPAQQLLCHFGPGEGAHGQPHLKVQGERVGRQRRQNGPNERCGLQARGGGCRLKAVHGTDQGAAPGQQFAEGRRHRRGVAAGVRREHQPGRRPRLLGMGRGQASQQHPQQSPFWVGHAGLAAERLQPYQRVRVGQQRRQQGQMLVPVLGPDMLGGQPHQPVAQRRVG